MDVFTMVVALVAISTVGGLVSRWLKVTQGSNKAQGDEALRQEIASLRERVATLERIATDPATDLKRQIQALEMRRAA